MAQHFLRIRTELLYSPAAWSGDYMDETEIFSIYLDLAQGQKADVETVSHALLEFAAAVKQAAAMVHPGMDLRIELAEGEESSLNLKTVWRVVGAYATDRKFLAGLAIGATSFLGGLVATDVYQQTALHEYIQGHKGTLSQQEIEEIAAAVARTATAEPVRSHVRQFYRALDRDSAIAGVGASLKPNKKPSLIVPSSDFKALSGVDEVTDITQQLREKITRETVVLVSPVLLESNRKWRFRSGTGEFGASIDDQKFLLDVLSGRRSVPMRGGILFDVELRTVEEKTPDGLWRPVDRHILRIVSMREPAHQSSMDFSAPHEKDGGDVGE